MGLKRVLFSLFLSALLAACGSYGDDKAPDFRYRLTVEVDTPEGLRTGRSVIEVKQSIGGSAGSGYSPKIFRRARGDAVAVDLPGGKTLYALHVSKLSLQWTANIFSEFALRRPDQEWGEQFYNVLEVEGVQTLPRRFPKRGALPERSAYPLLVTFEDENEPTSIGLIDPDDMAPSFGQGVKLRRITVELTDAPVTTGIRERLKWLGMSLKGREKREFPEGLPVGDFDSLFVRDGE
ncbi:MAG: hypothetical protein AAFR32_03180 [Pseudomonadota bacterium]